MINISTPMKIASLYDLYDLHKIKSGKEAKPENITPNLEIIPNIEIKPVMEQYTIFKTVSDKKVSETKEIK